MQDVVDAAGLGLQCCRQLRRYAGRRDLLHLAVVLRVVVEELIGRDDFGDGEDHAFLLGLIAAHGHLGAVQVAFNHHLLALHEGISQGRGQLVGILHLRNAEAGTVGSRFHEAGHAQPILNFLLGVLVLLASAKQDAVGHVHAKGAQVVVQCKLLEGQCFDEHGAGGVGQVEQVEVALHDAVLARCAMYGDVGVVEPHGLAFELEGEVVLVDLLCRAVGQVHVPVGAFDVDDEDVVTVVIEEGVQSLSRAQRDIVLRRVATTDDGNRSFQCVHSFFLFFLFVE